MPLAARSRCWLRPLPPLGSAAAGDDVSPVPGVGSARARLMAQFVIVEPEAEDATPLHGH
ncbi:hypothetical protein [Actinokineospora fastidiosa]|uniref:Uncharacterized protein n=1 Tax=Actinokineospora fastidiosa TaxID=1816 RepID=A0A918LGX6_9PSEU|nr:hypothetical protein [Actinokineospora fastidiosa]GGS48957.1 hypothetical protein GCM10010171_50080 [Actinokineospora fastidiosa]